MKRNLLFIIALFFCTLSYGQGEIDAYRYSNNDLSGTARGQAMGGAFGALGGDVTGVAVNPAGIGVYRSSEALANMSLTSPVISGNTNQQSYTKFQFDNLSYISYYPLVKGSMLSLNFGFNYSRIKNFNQTYTASSPKMNSSLTDYMALLTKGISSSAWTGNTDDYYRNANIPWLSALAWDGYLITEPDANNNYSSILTRDPAHPELNETVRPALKVSEKGRVEAYDFTVGSNIADKFYWGATFSITDMWYLMNSSYDEQFSKDGSFKHDDGSFRLENYLETKGSGIQIKAGVIFKPVEALRIGVAYHSPTWYTLTDYYWAGLTPNLSPRGIQGAGYTETPYPSSSTDYRVRTPGSWTVSLAGVLGTKAIISLDYELKDYSAMNLKDSQGADYTDTNDFMSNDYKNTSMLRAGLEFRFTPQFSGRVGYAWAQSPYQSKVNAFGANFNTGDVTVTAGTVPNYTLAGDVSYLTAGVGFKFTPQFYADFALVLRSQTDDLYYFTPIIDKTQTEKFDSYAGAFTNKTLKGLITLGYKF